MNESVDELQVLRERIAELERTNSELNEKWHADRTELLKLTANMRYWLGLERSQLLEGEHG